MNQNDLLQWLREKNEKKLEDLWKRADDLRLKHVGDEVHLRGLIEISNHCVRQCGYCGLRFGNKNLERYRMREEEIMACVGEAVTYRFGTVVLQSGEDYGIQTDWLSNLIRLIKRKTRLAVTLSLGERPEEDLEAWRRAGADRYLLRFETSDPDLYHFIHPSLSGRVSDRLSILQTLKKLGYQVGSGVMIGIPGQTFESLANDIDLFHRLDLDMIGVGPYIAHPETPLGSEAWKRNISDMDQVPATEAMTYKVMALTRLVCPEANIPSTTALATLNLEQGRELGLMRGANVVMPNLTPLPYRARYEIYPAKACMQETSQDCSFCLPHRIQSIGRKVGTGRGDRGFFQNDS